MDTFDPELTKLSSSRLRQIAADRGESRRRQREALVILEARAAAFAPAPLPPEPAPLAVQAPRHGVHIAGPVVDGLQRCARCGDVLAVIEGDYTAQVVPSRFMPWPAGTKVVRGPGWQAEYFGGNNPTCDRQES